MRLIILIVLLITSCSKFEPVMDIERSKTSNVSLACDQHNGVDKLNINSNRSEDTTLITLICNDTTVFRYRLVPDKSSEQR